MSPRPLPVLCKTLIGDCRETMRTLSTEGVRVQCCITSPPYFGLRDYGHPGQIGLESTPEEYVAAMVEVFACVWDLLADDGVLWLNLGDSYANDGKWGGSSGGKHARALHGDTGIGRGEGSRADDTIQLALCADEKHWLPMIQMAAEHVGATITHTESGNNLSVRMYGRVLVAILDEYIGGATTIDKHLRAVVWRLPDDALRLIASGYLAGDGHDDGGRVRLGFCRNYALERDLRTLAARLGATLTLKPTVAKYQRGEKPAFRGEWRWERSGHHNQKDRGEIIEIRASRARQFWDIAVEDEPHLFALASGVLTHNCKPNPMPESVTDRCTKSHEYLFLLAKNPRYYWNAEAMKEPAAPASLTRWAQNVDAQQGSERVPGKTNGTMKAVGGPRSKRDSFKRDDSKRVIAFPGQSVGTHREDRDESEYDVATRNRRSVWTVATRPYKGAHFATFPRELITPCVLATSRTGDLVLDPFMGSGTTAEVAQSLGRRWIGCEINGEYLPLQYERTAQASLFK